MVKKISFWIIITIIGISGLMLVTVAFSGLVAY